MQLPFDSFASLLVWLAGAGVVGLVLSFIQQWMKDKFAVDISGKIVAIVLCVLATIVVFAVQFVFKIPLFAEIADPNQLLQIAVNFLFILMFNQSSYALVVRKSDS